MTHLALVALSLIASVAATAAETNYRLAGILGAGTDHSIAVIELPDGRQRLFRPGDALGDGTIREITRVNVRIELPGEDLMLGLRGNPRLVAAPRVQAPSQGDGTDGDDAVDATTRTQQVSAGDVTYLLELSEEHAAAADGQTVTQETLMARLNGLLEIPSEARIVAVDEARVTTPRETLQACLTKLRGNEPAQLTVADAGDLRTIVVVPDSEQ